MSAYRSAHSIAGDANTQTVSQLRDEIAQRDSMLNESRKLFSDMKQRYEGLLHAMSNQNLESVSSNSSLQAEISDFPVDRSSELELQQWDLVWTHLISMITQVIDYPNVRAETGDQKRNTLMALVGKLCEEVSQPRENEEFAKLKRKYAKVKDALRKLKDQGEQLLQDVSRNKKILEGHIKGSKSKEKDALALQIRQLQDLLKQQIERQTEFLNYKPTRLTEATQENPVRRPCKRACASLDEINIEMSEGSYTPPVESARSPRDDSSDDEPPKRMRPSYTVGGDVRAAAVAKAKEKIKLREAEEEAEEILRRTQRRRQQQPDPEPKPDRKSKPKHKPDSEKKQKCALKKRYGTHVNQLVDLTNQLCSDYRKLGDIGEFDSASLSELSIDRLSLLNDSLTSEEQHFSSVSD